MKRTAIIVMLLILITNAITFTITVYLYAPEWCRYNGNPFDCDDYFEAKGIQ